MKCSYCGGPIENVKQAIGNLSGGFIHKDHGYCLVFLKGRIDELEGAISKHMEAMKNDSASLNDFELWNHVDKQNSVTIDDTLAACKECAHFRPQGVTGAVCTLGGIRRSCWESNASGHCVHFEKGPPGGEAAIFDPVNGMWV